jgi:predicted nucleic acid-binding protein
MPIGDTCYLYALFNESDALNQKARDDFREREGETIIVPDRVLEELFGITAYKRGIGMALETIKRILTNSGFAIYYMEEYEESEVFRMAEGIGKDISYVDYAILYLSKKRNEGMLTFDRQLLGLSKNQRL